MKYLLSIPNSKLDKETIELFKTVKGVEIKKLKINLEKLGKVLWEKLGVNINDEQHLDHIAQKVEEIIE